MRKGWISLSISDLIEPIETWSPRKDEDALFTYIDVSSVCRKTMKVVTPTAVEEKKAPSRARRVVRSGDVIFATIRPTLKRVAIIPPELDRAICSTGFFVLRPKEKVLSRYLFYWLLGDKFSMEMQQLQRGASYPAVSDGDVKEQAVAVPTLAEQQRIVALLDEAFEGIDTAIANTEKNLANARELFESYLKSVFNQQGEGWRVESVSEFSHHCLGKMLDKKKNKGELRPYLRNINVRWFEVATDDILEMRIENHEQERFLVEKGDLLICEGGYPGRAAIWEKDDPIYFQKALHRVRCKDSRLNWWLLYYLFLSDATGGLKSHFTGAGIQHFTGKALKSFAVPLPPEELVDELLKGIASIHEEVRRLESIYQQKLTALAELKQSLLQKAFSGELTASAAGSDTITEEADFA